MAHGQTRRDPARAAALADRRLAIFSAVAGAAGALLWLALTVLG